MKDKINILCVLWKGEFKRNGIKSYQDRDVTMLHETVSKHINQPFTMYCLTNDMEADIPAEKIKLKHNWPGWFSKIESFRSDLPEGKTLFLDLDSYLLRDLSPVLGYDDDLVLMENPRKSKPKKRGEKERIFKYNTGMFLLNSKKYCWIYERFKKDADYLINYYRGVDDIVGLFLPDNISTFPQRWVQRLRHLKKKNIPLGNETILMAGDNNFRDLSNFKQIKQMAGI